MSNGQTKRDPDCANTLGKADDDKRLTASSVTVSHAQTSLQQLSSTEVERLKKALVFSSETTSFPRLVRTLASFLRLLAFSSPRPKWHTLRRPSTSRATSTMDSTLIGCYALTGLPPSPFTKLLQLDSNSYSSPDGARPSAGPSPASTSSSTDGTAAGDAIASLSSCSNACVGQQLAVFAYRGRKCACGTLVPSDDVSRSVFPSRELSRSGGGHGGQGR